MKQFKVLSVALAVIVLGMLLYGCVGTQQKAVAYSLTESAESIHKRNQERLRREYGSALEMAAQQMVRAYSRELSPQSGKDWAGRVELYDYDLEENQREGYVACYAVLRWMARDFWSGVSYDWCDVRGVLYFYPRQRSVDKQKARFVVSDHNQHVVDVSSKAEWNRVKGGLIIEL